MDCGELQLMTPISRGISASLRRRTGGEEKQLNDNEKLTDLMNFRHFMNILLVRMGPDSKITTE